MKVGEKFVYENMGRYTLAVVTGIGYCKRISEWYVCRSEVEALLRKA